MATGTRAHATQAAGERLYSVREVAELWSVSHDLVLKLVRTGQLGSIELGARRIRIPASALDAYIAANVVRG